MTVTVATTPRWTTSAARRRSRGELGSVAKRRPSLASPNYSQTPQLLAGQGVVRSVGRTDPSEREAPGEVARRAVEAWNSRDVGGLAEFVDPALGLLLPTGLLGGDAYYGQEGLRAACAEAFDAWNEVRFEVDLIREVGERVALLGRALVEQGAGEPAEEHEAACVVRVREGRIMRARVTATHGEAMAIMGLRD